MLRINWRVALGTIGNFTRKHAPTILTIIGIGTGAAAVGLSIKATAEAMPKIEEKKQELGKEKLSVMEVVETAGTCYIYPAIFGTVSVACLICGSTQSARRNAALMAAYNMAENSLKDYKAKVLEVVGPKREDEICQRVAEERLNRNPPTDADATIAEGHGQTLCYDAMFGGYFYSDIETIRQAANSLNHQMVTMCEPYISLNQFFNEIGRKSIEVGDDLGWNADKGLIELSFSSQLANGRTPCLVISYKVIPGYDYF